MRKKIKVPIYDADVFIIVNSNIEKHRKNLSYLFGPAPSGNYNALCSSSGDGYFGLFFIPSAVNLQVISHEVFHLTHRILDWAGCNFDSTHHEQAALLHGYLMVEVCKKLKISCEQR